MSPVATKSLSNITIVGNGLMGTGIAQICTQSGFNVVLCGRTIESNQRALEKITVGLNRVAKKLYDNDEHRTTFVNEQLNRLTMTIEIEKAVCDADIVLEAVVENLKVKQKLLCDIEHFASENCILVTNTSSFQLMDVGAKLVRMHNFAGLHFFNPVTLMKLVEVIRTDATADRTYNQLIAFCRAIDKTTVASKDTTGFIVNRLLVPYMLDAMHMADRGDATRSDIDIAMKCGASHPLGPFELADLIGLDTMKFVIDGWHLRYPDDPRFEPSAYLDKLVAEGRLGRKSGEGFFKYN